MFNQKSSTVWSPFQSQIHKAGYIYLVEVLGGWNPKEMQDYLEIGDTSHFEANVHHFAIYILAV